MGHIVTPEGVDFLIQSPPLTEKEREELSEFIRMRKKEIKKRSLKQARKKPAASNA